MEILLEDAGCGGVGVGAATVLATAVVIALVIAATNAAMSRGAGRFWFASSSLSDVSPLPLFSAAHLPDSRSKTIVRNSARFAGSDKLFFMVGTVDFTTSVVKSTVTTVNSNLSDPANLAELRTMVFERESERRAAAKRGSGDTSDKDDDANQNQPAPLDIAAFVAVAI